MTRLLSILAVVLLTATGGAWLLNQPASTAFVSAAVAQDAEEPNIEELMLPDQVLGNEDAPVTLIEYASFTCPHCANFHGDQFKKLKAEYIDTGKVKFIHREVYFDRFGLWGALLAHCGGGMRYFGIAGMLYDQQKDWIGSGDPDEILDNLRKMGKTAGLEEETINACFADQEMATRLVATYQANAEADGVSATPTLIIDGEKHANMSYDKLKEIIDERLAAQDG